MGNGLNLSHVIRQSRPLNLILIAIAQLLLFYGMSTIDHLNNEKVSLSSIWISCILATSLFTLGGYYINDFFDFENDKTLGKKNRFLSRSQLLLIYSGTLVLNFIVCLIACKILENYALLLFFIGISISLYSYSSFFKRNKIFGNIVVSILSSLSIGIVLITSYLTEGSIAEDLINLVQFFMLFIFTLSMAREITKDCEDIEGDEKFNVISVPIKYGIDRSKIIINLYLLLLIFINLVYLYHHWEFFTVILIILSLMIISTTLLSIFYLGKANNRSGFKLVSKIQKVIFGTGIILLGLQLFST